MTFSTETHSKAPVLSLTSMLDVIFLLLCFFVTVSVFSQWESEISIQLPSAKTADEPDRLPGEIILNVSASGVVSVNGETLSLEVIESRLKRLSEFYPGQAVIIRADKAVTYDSLVKVIDACRAGGVWNFSLATEEER